MSTRDRIKKLEQQIAATTTAGPTDFASLADVSREWEAIQKRLRNCTDDERADFDRSLHDAYYVIFPRGAR